MRKALLYVLLLMLIYVRPIPVQAEEAAGNAMPPQLNQSSTPAAENKPAPPPADSPDVMAGNELTAIYDLIAKGDYKAAGSRLAGFMARYGSTKFAKKAARLQGELAVIGRPIPPDWGILKWLQGEKEADLACKNLTLLFFWEVWCPYCQREAPKVQATYAGMKDAGLNVISFTSLNRSATEEMLQKFLAANNITFPVAREDGRLRPYFNAPGVPAAAVVKEGKIIWRGHPARLTEEMINRWL